MKIELSYNDLELLLTPADRQQIKEMPEPSQEQGKLMIRKWNDYFGEKVCQQEPDKIQTGIIFLKTYIKVRDTLPELFV